jgi:hypothetical protein
MRFSILAVALSSAIFTTGCSSLVSVSPFVTEQDARFDPGLVGVWHDSSSGDMYVVERDASQYAITYLSHSASVSKFHARLTKAGDAELLDVESASDDPFQIPVHMALRVWPEASTLRVAFLDSNWLKQQAALELSTQIADDRTLINAASGGTASAARDFLLKYGSDAKAYGEPATLQKAQ